MANMYAAGPQPYAQQTVTPQYHSVPSPAMQQFSPARQAQQIQEMMAVHHSPRPAQPSDQFAYEQQQQPPNAQPIVRHTLQLHDANVG